MKTSHPRRLLSLVFFLFLQATVALAQGKQVTISLRNATLKQVITAIEKQTPYNISYRSGLFDNKGDIDIDVRNASVKEVLTQALKSRNLDFEIISDKSIVIKEKQRRNPQHEGGQKDDGQKRKYTGLVTDESGEPIIGATLTCNGKALGVTDVDGRFNIKAYEGQKLTVTFIGMADETVKLSSSPSLNITLSEGRKNLQEVVVVGYGTQTKARVTGSIAQIKADNLENLPVTSFEQALAGQLPGVQIMQQSGAPGNSATMKIRGSSSITAGTNPLIVIDGFPMTTEDLTSLSPEDIESVDVLKDAASTAIYGSRGANGVVVVSTKKGKSGKVNVSAKAYWGFQKLANKVELMDAYEYAKFVETGRNNYWVSLNPAKNKVTDPNSVRDKMSRIPDYLLPYLNGETGLVNTDWQDEVFRSAPISEYSVSVSGGSDKMSYYTSLGYQDQQGIIENSGFKRLSARSNLSAKLSKRISLELNLAPSYSVRKKVAESSHKGDGVLTMTTIANPACMAYDAEGNLYYGDQIEKGQAWGTSAIESPLAIAKGIEDKVKTFDFLGNLSLNVKLTNDLFFKSHFGLRYNHAEEDYFRPSYLASYNTKAPTMATGKNYNYTTKNWISENTLDYKIQIKEHYINLLLGVSAQREDYNTTYMNASNFPNDNIRTLNAGIVTEGNTQHAAWSLFSYFARVNYAYGSKYLLSLSYRRDGSSRFGKNNRYGSFPSASVGWRMSEESWMKKQKVFSDLKWRISYGVTGNFQIPNYSSYSLMGIANYVYGTTVANGLYPNTAGNPNIGWEKTKQWNWGADMAFLKNLLTFTVDYYISTTNGLLLNVPIPAASGFTSALRNYGKLRTRGFEASARADITFGKLSWQPSVNFTTSRTKVLALGPNQTQILNRASLTKVGGQVGTYYVYNVIGVYKSQEDLNKYPHLSTSKIGSYIYEDVDGDKKITDADRVEKGNYNPDFTMGFNNTFKYKNVDFGFTAQWVYGSKIFNGQNVFLLNGEGWGNSSKKLFDHWWSADQPTGYYATPRSKPTDKLYENSTLMVEDGSFLRFTNITLGYNLPKKWLRKVGIGNVRLYATGHNLITITDYSGYNPEANSATDPLRPGIDSGGYPVSKSLIFGVNVSF